MSIWIIEPHDPLIFRDGRPFGPTPGAQAESLPFPFPSTTTGGVRTRAGSNKDGIFDLDAEGIRALKNLSVRGPLLIQLAPDDKDIDWNNWLIPAPSDALLIAPEEQTDKDSVTLKQLVPLQLTGAKTDFDQKNPEFLYLIGQTQYDPGKPAKMLQTTGTGNNFRNGCSIQLNLQQRSRKPIS